MQLPDRALFSSHGDQENLYLHIYFNLPAKLYVFNPLNKLSKFSKPVNSFMWERTVHEL